MIIDGKKIADEIVARLKPKSQELQEKKFLGAVLVGDDAASLSFLKLKEKVAKELGIPFRLYTLSGDLSTDELRQEIGRLAGVKNCGGFLIELPFPKHVNQHYVLNAIPKEKDVDVMSEAALGAFYTGRSGIAPLAATTVEEIAKRYIKDLRSANAVVVGAGFLIGKPAGFWLKNRVASLTMIDSKAQHLRAKLKDADLVVCGVGKGHLVSADEVKEGAVVVDFGFDKIDGKMAGDFNPEGAEERNISYTPTPGGTGPILVAKLFENFYALNA